MGGARATGSATTCSDSIVAGALKRRLPVCQFFHSRPGSCASNIRAERLLPRGRLSDSVPFQENAMAGKTGDNDMAQVEK